MRKTLLPIALIAALLVGCKSSDAPDSSGTTGGQSAAAEKTKVVFIPKSTGNAYFNQVAKGFEKSAADLGIEFATRPLDARVLVATVLLGVLAALVAAVVPLGTSLRVDLTRSLKTSSRDGGGRRSAVRATLVAVQAALSVILLVGTGLLGKSLHNIRSANLGIDANNLVVVKPPIDGELSMDANDIAALAKIGYKGFYSFEWEKRWHPEIEEPEIAIAQYERVAAEYLKESSG